MATISNNTIVSLIDTQTNSGTVLLPKTSDIPYRAILFKDLYGTFDTKPLTLNTQSPDVFEDGTSVKRFNDKFTYLTLYADTSHSKWVVLSATQNNSITVSTLNGVQTGYISSLNVNSLTFGPGNGWLDLTALRAILVSTIQIDAGIGNFSSISGNGSQIVNLNAISSLSLQSTVTGLGTVGYISSSQLLSTTLGLGNIYLSTNIVPSSIVGLGTLGYISSSQLLSTILGLGNIYLSTNIVPSTIVGLGTFGYISTTQLQSTVRGLGTAGYLSTNIVPSTILGLGTFGYISTTQLQSTVRGLGTFGYLSSFNFISSFNISTGSLNTSTLFFLDINTNARQTLLVSSGVLTLNGQSVADIGSGGSGLTASDYVCGGYLASDQTILINTDTNITFSDDFDPQNWYNTGTYRFQPTIPGYYEVSLQVWWAAGSVTNNQYNIQILKNSTTVAITQSQITTSVGLSQNATKIIYMNGSTDFLRFTVFNGNSASVNIQSGGTTGGTFFSAALLTNGSSGEPLTSTVSGLGNVGYISSLSLQSTIRGLGTFGYLSTNIVPSTIVGLGTLGYLSSSQLLSTTLGLGNIYLSTNIVPSTILGLGTFGYISTTQLQSTVRGLGTLGYLSSSQLLSTTLGLGNIYLSTNIVPSTVTGLGTTGYISSTQLTSTVTGLGAFGYISSTQLTSTVGGLGNIYLSTNIVPSTIIGLGAFGYLSSLNSISSLNISTGNLFANIFTTRSISTNLISSGSLITSVINANSYNGTTIGGNINMNGGVFPTTPGNRDLGSSNARWNNFWVSTISSIHTTTSTLFVQTNIIASTINASTIGVNRLTGPDAGFNTFTNNLFPNSQSATLGYVFGGEGGGGWYSNINGRQFNSISTNTNIIGSATGAGDINSTVRVLGTLSTQNQQVSSLTANILTTSNIETRRISKPADMGGQVPTVDLEPALTTTQLGYPFAGNFNGFFSRVCSVSTITSNIIHPLGSNITSSIRVIGTLSTQNQVASSITTNILFAISNVSTNLITTAFLRGAGSVGGSNIYIGSVLPDFLGGGSVNIGNAVTNTFASIWGSNIRTDTIIPRFGDHPQSTVRIQGTLSTGILNVSTIFAQNVNASTILASTIITPSISTNNISTIRLSVSSINSHLIPAFDNTYDLGSIGSKWRDLYVGGTSIHLGNSLVLSEDIDGKLSTNKEIIAPAIQANSVSTLELTTALFSIRGPIGLGLTGIDFNLNNTNTSFIGLNDSSSELSVWNYTAANINIKSFNPETTAVGNIILKGTNIKTDGILDLSYNEISNVAQTANISSAATNFIMRRRYYDAPANCNSLTLNTFKNVLTDFPTATPITYRNLPTTFYTYLNCTISFRCNGLADNLAYFVTLVNSNTGLDLSGQIFNDSYPFIENSNNLFTTNHSISFQEQFYTSSWENNISFIPRLFVRASGGSLILSNMKFSMVYEPVI